MRIRLLTAAACLSLAWAPSLARPVAAQVAPAAMAPDTSWVARGALYEVFVRDFSPAGNLQGVIAGLDRIQAAGANVVWLMPIFPVGVEGRKGTLGSPYAVRDYLAIDSAFGGPVDLRALVQAVHARGMKLILGWVPNHTAPDAVWVRQHPDFYVRDAQGRLTVPRDEKGNLTDWTDVAQLDYQNPAMRRAMIDVLRHWLVEYGIDGFRMDVAGFVPDVFWREAVPVLRSAVPRPILLLAEWGDLRMHRMGIDLTYAWDSYSRLKAVWKGAPASSFVSGELPDMTAMPRGGMRLRFTTNHDETAWDNPPVTIFGGPAGARAAYVAMTLLPGRPLLYNGQEIESPLKLRLFERDPIAWDIPGAAEALAFYRKVLDLARTHPAFLAGTLREIGTSAPDDIIAYQRDRVLVLVNARPHAVQFTVTGLAVDGSRDLLSDRIQAGDTIALPAFGTAVLELSRR